MVTTRRLLSGVALVIVLGACRAIAGLHDLEYVASSGTGDDSGDSGAGNEAGGSDDAPVCNLPSAGTAAVRVGDFVPSTDRYAVCVHRTDGTSPLDDVPLPSAGGPGCPSSIGFADVLAPIGLPPGTYDMSVTAPGSGCGKAAVSVQGVTLADGATTGVYLLVAVGSPVQAIELVPLPETTAGEENSSLRLVNAMVGGTPLDFGFAAGLTQPTTLLLRLFSDVPYGRTGAPWAGAPYTVDANGYVSADVRSSSPAYGIAPSGQTDLTRLIKPVITIEHGYSVFAAGSSTDARFPLELVMCDEASPKGAFTDCGETVEVRTATFDPSLTGTFEPLVSVRLQGTIDTAAHLDADVECVVDVFPSTTRDAIVAEAMPDYPYAVEFKDTPGTPFDDPTDQDGGIPAAPTSPPCAPSDSLLQSFLACTEASCSTKPNDPSGTVIPIAGDCLSNNCYSQTVAFVSGEPVCWSCALSEMESGSPWSKLQGDCEQSANAGYAFDGDPGTLILSRFPIVSSDQWVLPSTQWRVAIAHAVLAPSANTTLDFYCTYLNNTYTGPTHPYVGQYGGGAPTSDAEWEAEQLLEAQKLVAYVQRTSGQLGRRAVVAGNFYAGGAWPAQSIAAIGDPSTFPTLNTFPLAMTPGYVPACTFCASNPITTPPGTAPTVTSNWTVFSLLVNVAATDVTSSGVIDDKPTIAYQPPDGGSYEIPPSQLYGYAATVRVRP
jgi:hypothetical protein